MLQINNNVTENKNVFSNKHQTRSRKLSVLQAEQILKYLQNNRWVSQQKKKRKKQREEKKNKPYLERSKIRITLNFLFRNHANKMSEINTNLEFCTQQNYPSKVGGRGGGQPFQTKIVKTENLLICLARNVKTSSSDRNKIIYW